MREKPGFEKELMSRELVLNFNPVLPVLLVTAIGSVIWGWGCVSSRPAGVAPTGGAERGPGCDTAHAGCCAVGQPLMCLARPTRSPARMDRGDRRGRRVYFDHLIGVLTSPIILPSGLLRDGIHLKHLLRPLILMTIQARWSAARCPGARRGLCLPGSGGSTCGSCRAQAVG